MVAHVSVPEKGDERGGLPYVRGHGVTDAQIETMLVADPRRYFETSGS
jgi:predicted metal-dependent phosphotriesterase family hydrolase